MYRKCILFLCLSLITLCPFALGNAHAARPLSPPIKILLTGFEPFGGETTNPSWEAVKLVPSSLTNKIIIKHQLPVEFKASVLALQKIISTEKPDVIISIGQAGNRSCLSLEKIAVNYVNARIPDNAGFKPLNSPIVQDGPAAYFTTLPLIAMQANVEKHHLPCEISMSAGTYVCNYIMYKTLNWVKSNSPHTKVGFFHVPYSPEQTITKTNATPSMPLETMAQSITYALEALD